MSETLFNFENIDQGTPLDGLSIPALTRAALARFAGATDNYNPVHLDDKVAAAMGKSSVFAPIDLVMGYVGRMVQSFFAEASIRRYALRLVKHVWPGDVLTCRGTVAATRIEAGEHIVEADVWADNQRGECVAKGRVIAVVAANDKKALSKAAKATGLYFGKTVVTVPSKTTVATKKKTVKKKKK